MNAQTVAGFIGTANADITIKNSINEVLNRLM